MTPTKADFDKAVQQPWRSTTCLVAQMMLRNGMDPTVTTMKDGVEDVAERYGLETLMGMFDKHFNVPGDEKTSPELIALREELPNG